MGRTTFATTLGAVILASALTGCESQSTVSWQDEQEQHFDELVSTENWSTYNFYYYPQHQVYYDPVDQKYFWFDNGGWYEGPKLPMQFVLRKTPMEFIELQTNKPWTQHDAVAASYGPSTPFEGSTVMPKANVDALDTYSAAQPDMP